MIAPSDVTQSPFEAICAVARIAAERGASRESAERVTQRLGLCLRRLEGARQSEAVPNFSSLNADGSPVELAFSSADSRLRFTAEVAGPDVDAHARIEEAFELSRALASKSPSRDEIDFWRSLQAGLPLRWGAWLGVRQGEPHDRVKLYVEVPAAHRSAAGSELHRLAADSRLVMLGYDCSGGGYEYYFRQPPLVDPGAGESLLQRQFRSEQRAAVIEAFAELCRVPARTALRWINFGYSVTPRPDGGEPVFSLFARSRSLGNLARVREFFLAHESDCEERASTYRDLLGPIPQGTLPDHGTVAVTALDEGRIEVRVGLSAAALSSVCKLR